MGTLLIYAATPTSPAMRHEVPVSIADPFLLVLAGERSVVLTNWLERDRIAAVLPGAELLDVFELGLRELRQSGMSPLEAECEIVSRAVARLKLSEGVVPWDFPLAIADRLRADGIELRVDDIAFTERRRRKTGAELDGVRAAQRAGLAAMEHTARRLAGARTGADGRLRDPDGEPLLAEVIRAEIGRVCAEHGASCPAGMIVASVHNGGGHDPGNGPLPAGLPIVVDIFPRDEASGCWGDMTRTFLVGEPQPADRDRIAEQARLVRAALDQATDAVRPGVTGRELHAATCDLFEAAGWPTQRTGGEGGFQFALGHGVGLDVHEAPGLGLAGSEPFVAGDVVAIEPGLADPRTGEVRLEDLLLVTEEGSELLSPFPYDLAPRPAGTGAA